MPLLLPLAVIVTFQLVDYASFLLMVARHGLDAEANPFIVMVALQLGLPGLTLVKLAGLVIAGSAVVLLAPRHRRLAAVLTLAAVGFGGIGALTNVASLI